MERRMVNITFQVQDEQSNSWEEAPIVYVLENVPADKNIEELLHCISVVKGYVTVRTARLFLNDPITSKQACKYNGGYYQANWKKQAGWKK
jgi:hypothetical protein